jgi:hypothetical protein
MFQLCTPSIIYVIFSVTQILIDLYKGLYNTVFIKIIVSSMVTLLLNILCEKGLSFVSWIIVFIPFILMTLIVTMLLYVFGLDAASGTINYNCKDKKVTTINNSIEGVTRDIYGNIIIYYPEYNPSLYPIYYQSPNIIVHNPHLNDEVSQPIVKTYNSVPGWSNSQEYQS